MCGIVGVVGRPLSNEKRNEIVRTLQHRGPDDKDSMLIGDSVFLGHTRLSIIDLSAKGHQPMSNEDKSIWLTYNGEIYNFLELRKDLEKAGHKFQSNTDTEVILHLYEEKGEDCVKDLNGMFAFALYDTKKERLFIARDRLGVKPLYYAFLGDSFIFSSEIKAILATGLIRQDINWQAIYDYFSFLYVPCPHTAFQGINELPPAHYLIFDLKRKRFDITCFWEPWGGSHESIREYEDAKQKLRMLLEDAVKRELISDVPLGVFLSGGIDSSILTAIASRCSRVPLKTFTVVFEGKGIAPHDDRQYAEKMSRFLKTEHREIVVDVSNPEELLDLVRCFDQPFANPTFYLSYLISKVTKQYVKVALSGAGGDELFGGYPRYKALRYSTIMSLLPRALNKPLSRLAGLIRENPDNALPRRIKLFMRAAGYPLPEQYLRWTYYLSDEEKERLLDPAKLENKSIRRSTEIIEAYLSKDSGNDVLNRIQYTDLKTFLPDNVLEYTDKTSMALGLEVRVPYLDHRIVELSFKIPKEFKIQGRDTKRVMKDAFKDLLPREILEAPKRGFCAPMAVWIEKHFDFYFDNLLTPQYIKKQGILNWEFIQNLRMQHKRKKRDNSMELFGIIMFDVWYRRYFG